MDTTGEKEKRTSKKNVDGRRTSSHDNKKLRTRSVEKQRGRAFGFRKTATADKKTTDILLFSISLKFHFFQAHSVEICYALNLCHITSMFHTKTTFVILTKIYIVHEQYEHTLRGLRPANILLSDLNISSETTNKPKTKEHLARSSCYIFALHK